VVGGDLNLADSGEFAAGGNGENPPIEDELVRFLWPGCVPRRAGALELNGVASDGL
jgi:hypothetical protein